MKLLKLITQFIITTEALLPRNEMYHIRVLSALEHHVIPLKEQEMRMEFFYYVVQL